MPSLLYGKTERGLQVPLLVDDQGRVRVDANLNPSVSDIDVDGTPDASTFLRGDGRWATVSPTGSALFDAFNDEI